MMQVTDEMLYAAMKKAVELGLVPKTISTEQYLTTYESMKQVLQAAFDKADK